MWVFGLRAIPSAWLTKGTWAGTVFSTPRLPAQVHTRSDRRLRQDCRDFDVSLYLQWEALWQQQQQQKVNKLGQALNKCHSLTSLHPHFAQTTQPCPFKSGERLWFPPPTVKGRAWRSLAELRSFEHVCARVVLSDWSEDLLLQRAFRVVCRPGARRSVPGACTFHSQAGPGAPGSYSLHPRVGVFTPGSRYGCSARGGPGSPSPGRDTRP